MSAAPADEQIFEKRYDAEVGIQRAHRTERDGNARSSGPAKGWWLHATTAVRELSGSPRWLPF